MNRRTFILWGGALGTISLSLTATSASFNYDVSPMANFRILPQDPKAALDVADNTENTVTTHDWFVDGFYADSEISGIRAEYPSGTSFANVTDTEVTIEFLQSNGNYSEIKFDGVTTVRTPHII